jgi:hypothetical protein
MRGGERNKHPRMTEAGCSRGYPMAPFGRFNRRALGSHHSTTAISHGAYQRPMPIVEFDDDGKEPLAAV